MIMRLKRHAGGPEETRDIDSFRQEGRGVRVFFRASAALTHRETSMFRVVAVIALSLIGSIGTSGEPAQSPKSPANPTDTWAPFRFLVGTWEGTSSGQPGNGTVRREYRLVLRDRFIEGRSTSTYPAQEKNPKGEVHEDFAYFSYDRSSKAFKMRQFHVEGFVSQYVATPTGSSEIVFNSESLENIPAGWRARETWRITSADSFVEVFELAEPGKDFAVYSETRLTRRR
jgi:hypothetical protein